MLSKMMAVDPPGQITEHWELSGGCDPGSLDTKGKLTIRRAGRKHHNTVTDLTTGELLSIHLIQPHKT